MKEREVQNLELKYEGLKLEYEYVNQMKNERIKEKEEEIEVEKKKSLLYESELRNTAQILEEVQQELERINNSRWWKLRGKIIGVKKKIIKEKAE